MLDLLQLFVANTSKPQEVINILVANRTKLLRFLGDFTTEKGPAHLSSCSKVYFSVCQFQTYGFFYIGNWMLSITVIMFAERKWEGHL